MNRSQPSLILSLVLVFASGIAVGGVGYHLYTAKSVVANASQSPDKFRSDFITDMKVKLSLSEEQITKVNVVLDQTRLQYKELRDRMKPDMSRIKSEQVEKINSLLNPVQQKQYEELRVEREAKSKQKSRPPSGN